MPKKLFFAAEKELKKTRKNQSKMTIFSGNCNFKNCRDPAHHPKTRSWDAVKFNKIKNFENFQKYVKF